jgi:hypothetical protein
MGYPIASGTIEKLEILSGSNTSEKIAFSIKLHENDI